MTTKFWYRFERTEYSWLRFDVDGSNPGDRYWATGKTDTSPRYAHWEGNNYNPDCPSCWLGHGHTTARHQQNLSK